MDSRGGNPHERDQDGGNTGPEDPLPIDFKGSEWDVRQLTGGKLLAQNTLVNFLGRFSPMLVAVFAIPILVKELGTERFGILTLAWMVIGYFSLFDLGLGRALTKLVAEKLGVGGTQEVIPLIWTGMILMGGLGLLGVPAVAIVSPFLVNDLLKIPLDLREDTLQAFFILGISVPIVITTTGFIGILEAHQRFVPVNVVRAIMGIFMYLSPLMVLPFSNSLTMIVIVLAIGRCISAVAYLSICLRVMPALRTGFGFARGAVRQLFAFGGWITVNNIVDPFMVYLDRFLIGAMISMTAVAYYTTPYEVVTKLWLIPMSFAGVFFPVFSSTYARDQTRTATLFEQASKAVFCTMFPIIAVMVIFAQEGLTLWIGKEFASNSSFVFQWLTVGVFINSIARIPDALIQGVGRPDLVVKLKMIQIPFYIVLVWLGIRHFGIEGAAVVWVLRILVDTTLLLEVARRLLPTAAHRNRRLFWFVLSCCSILVLSVVSYPLWIKSVIFVSLILAFAVVSWSFLISSDEKAFVRRQLRLRYILK